MKHQYNKYKVSAPNARTRDGILFDSKEAVKELERNQDDFLNDIEANEFAMSLLMPEEIVRNHVASYRMVFPADITKISEDFKVDKEIMTLRLLRLGFKFNY